MRIAPLSAARRVIGGARSGSGSGSGPAETRSRRRGARADAPRTIIPTADPAVEPLSPARLDAARERLRAEIPPRADDE